MKKVQVNLGCGSNILKDFINIDIYDNPEEKNYVKGTALNIPLKNASVDYIVLDQVLEHIAMADIVPVLYEIRRVLKVGGRCVIMVPDFEGAVKQWLSVNHNGSFDPQTYKYFSEVIYGNQNHEGEFHKTPMCAGYLHFVLKLVGLTKHTISFYPEYTDIPEFPGMRPYPPGAKLRNAQLIADITKV
jgi:SAM-dependent methyltransferase